MGTTLEPGQVRNVLHEMRGKLDGGSTRAPARIPSDQPSARVIAFTQQVGDGENAILQGNQQMILSVAIPGQPRYGYRWRGIIHTRRFFAEWTDLPIRVSRRGHVDIEWHEVDSVLDVAAQEVKRAGEQMEQRLADLQNGGPQRMMQQLIESVATDPAQRALLEQQVAEASSQPWANPLAPPPPPTSPPSGPATTDPAALLAQLADLRAAGALTDAEYATERQKILDQI
jgi:hypothetical protein